MPRRRIYDENGNGRRTLEKPEPSADSALIVRCAIYTRKSTSEGLDQAFNSLDAQREAGVAPLLLGGADQNHDGEGVGNPRHERPGRRP